MSRKKVNISELNLKKIGGRIAYIRIKNDLNQDEFGKYIELSKGNISSLENHKYEPSFQTIVKIIEHYKINPVWFLAGDGEMVRQGMECDTCLYKVENFEHRVTEKKIGYDPKILELLKMTRIVLESGTEFSDSLAVNIRSFFHSVQMEKRLSDVESELSIVKDKIKKCPAEKRGSVLKKKM